MRILITADLHYDSLRSRAPAEAVAGEICRAGGDVLVLVGDSAGADHQTFRDCLRLFAGFPGAKLLVPGNHCLWCLPGEDSIDRYERIVPALAGEEGFTVLDHSPLVTGGIGLVGSIGWYDYSYRDEELGLPTEFYAAKVTPGAAARMPEHKQLVERLAGRLEKRHFDLTVQWRDGVRVRMGLSDAEFLDRLVGRLEGQLAAMDADDAVGEVVAFTHHLPFRELIPADRPEAFTFAAAYMGSDRIGRALQACRKLTRVYCGHSHWAGVCRVGRITAVNVGCTYTHKRFEVLDL